MTDHETSKLLKYRAIPKRDVKTGLWYHVALALRMNGRVEVYSDFRLVHEFYDACNQIVDIETDLNQFYIKVVKDSQSVTPESDPKKFNIELRQIRHLWKNKIG